MHITSQKATKQSEEVSKAVRWNDSFPKDILLLFKQHFLVFIAHTYICVFFVLKYMLLILSLLERFRAKIYTGWVHTD